MKLVVGLGNPGKEYLRSRHNVGFLVIDLLAKRTGIRLRRRKSASMGESSIGQEPVLLAKPMTFMNRSGDAVGPIFGRLRLLPTDLLVVYDDLDLPFGKLRLRPRGSSGGHNGMKSIIASLETEDFPRLRIGIGRPENEGKDAVHYVLGPFRKAESEALDEVIARAADAVESFVTAGIEVAMNRFND